jgi:hypothetical protein
LLARSPTRGEAVTIWDYANLGAVILLANYSAQG